MHNTKSREFSLFHSVWHGMQFNCAFIWFAFISCKPNTHHRKYLLHFSIVVRFVHARLANAHTHSDPNDSIEEKVRISAVFLACEFFFFLFSKHKIQKCENYDAKVLRASPNFVMCLAFQNQSQFFRFIWEKSSGKN